MTNSFDGFSQDTFDFLNDLAANNTKDWFNASRARYEACWLAPAQGFITALEPLVSAFAPPHTARPKINGSIRRIFRDVRFSADKTPYDPRLHMVFWCGGHPNRSPALHLVLHRDGFGCGAGQWALTPAQLAGYRAAVCDGKSRAGLLAALDKAQARGCTLTPESLKRLPAGFDIVAGHETLLRRKSLVVRTLAPRPVPAQLMTGKCVAYTASLLSDLLPVSAWLHANL